MRVGLETRRLTLMRNRLEKSAHKFYVGQTNPVHFMPAKCAWDRSIRIVTPNFNHKFYVQFIKNGNMYLNLSTIHKKWKYVFKKCKFKIKYFLKKFKVSNITINIILY